MRSWAKMSMIVKRSDVLLSMFTRVWHAGHLHAAVRRHLPGAAERGRLAGRGPLSDSTSAWLNLLEPFRRRLARIVGVVDPEAVEHQAVGQGVNLGREDFQAVAADGPGELVENARRDLSRRWRP